MALSQETGVVSKTNTSSEENGHAPAKEVCRDIAIIDGHVSGLWVLHGGVHVLHGLQLLNARCYLQMLLYDSED